MKRDFNVWLSSFKDSISTYDYYVDFNKVFLNVENIKIELNILNSLIGSDNIEDEFKEIVIKYPETLKCIPILLAVRSNEISILDNNHDKIFNFSNLNLPIEEYTVFMRKTGLFKLIQDKKISNLFDYVTGVETGLDSNARKNRGGHLMENLVESYIKELKCYKKFDYFKEMYISEVSNNWNIDLSSISNKGKSEKRFDFVIKTDNMIYAIETNFYSSGGSKLNETARSYKTLFLESDEIEGFTFVWFTDGKGWKRAKNNLEETFDVTENIYNINDLKDGIMKTLFI
ncbi:restriction endonuclease [Peptostreptococcus anaerobius]|uniref:Type-2 restriction enzyme n=1 Tax=Peptostreptococcus porci TaxID=2652282 RepID=A0A6N7X1W8_9FIRM|nr:type II restriction endonuclease [Peptostreptococcus porci]MDY2794614.1 type II restriction endonuclease [Peptostreptococcus porci]MST62091.1 restriction endonuclease [Peptostreptococcus porci]